MLRINNEEDGSHSHDTRRSDPPFSNVTISHNAQAAETQDNNHANSSNINPSNFQPLSAAGNHMLSLTNTVFPMNMNNAGLYHPSLANGNSNNQFDATPFMLGLRHASTTNGLSALDILHLPQKNSAVAVSPQVQFSGPPSSAAAAAAASALAFRPGELFLSSASNFHDPLLALSSAASASLTNNSLFLSSQLPFNPNTANSVPRDSAQPHPNASNNHEEHAPKESRAVRKAREKYPWLVVVGEPCHSDRHGQQSSRRPTSTSSAPAAEGEEDSGNEQQGMEDEEEEGNRHSNNNNSGSNNNHTSSVTANTGSSNATKRKYRRMYCHICATFNPLTPWATMKARKFEHDSFRDHEKSTHHQRAVDEKHVHETQPMFPLGFPHHSHMNPFTVAAAINASSSKTATNDAYLSAAAAAAMMNMNMNSWLYSSYDPMLTANAMSLGYAAAQQYQQDLQRQNADRSSASANNSSSTNSNNTTNMNSNNSNSNSNNRDTDSTGHLPASLLPVNHNNSNNSASSNNNSNTNGNGNSNNNGPNSFLANNIAIQEMRNLQAFASATTPTPHPLLLARSYNLANANIATNNMGSLHPSLQAFPELANYPNLSNPNLYANHLLVNQIQALSNPNVSSNSNHNHFLHAQAINNPQLYHTQHHTNHDHNSSSSLSSHQYAQRHHVHAADSSSNIGSNRALLQNISKHRKLAPPEWLQVRGKLRHSEQYLANLVRLQQLRNPSHLNSTSTDQPQDLNAKEIAIAQQEKTGIHHSGSDDSDSEDNTPELKKRKSDKESILDRNDSNIVMDDGDDDDSDRNHQEAEEMLEDEEGRQKRKEMKDGANPLHLTSSDDNQNNGEENEEEGKTSKVTTSSAVTTTTTTTTKPILKKKYRECCCKYCAEYQPGTPWAVWKPRKYELSVFQLHENSVIHRRAVTLCVAAKRVQQHQQARASNLAASANNNNSNGNNNGNNHK